MRKAEETFLLEVRDGDATLELPFEALGLVAEDRVQRIQAFEIAVSEIGPTRDLSALRQAVDERLLSDEEAGTILDLLVNGVAAIQARILNGLLQGKATLNDLVPESLDYFERFSGPDPGDSKPEEYLLSVLPEYRRTLLERDPRQGLGICLLGALRNDLCPAPWLQDMDNESLWEHLTASRSELDPFSLLAALDLALYRQEDDRFRSFAEEAVGRLAADEFLWPTDLDCYQLIPVLASYVLNRIQLTENGASRQPFWERMCAWMHATFVARGMHDSGIDLDGLIAMVNRHLLPAGAFANSVDLRREPMVEAGSISPVGFRRQVLGRLVALHDHHVTAGRAMPGNEDIRQALERLEAKGIPLLITLLPSPLEGHRRPREHGKELADETRGRLLELTEDLLIENLAHLSQHYALPEELKAALREAISREGPEKERIDPEETLAWLWRSGTIAAAERDAEIAQAIAAAAFWVAPFIREEPLVWEIVETLLRSAAAFEQEAAWAEWLEEQFLGLANRFQAGDLSTLLWRHMQELKKVTKLELGIFRRAEAVASAAASGPR